MKRTPLRRYTPLRATKDRPRPGDAPTRPKKRKPTPGQKWDGWRNREREMVRRRSWKCESVEPCSERGVQVHHPFGRIDEPWASSRLTCQHLCVPHHNRVTGELGRGLDIKLRDQLRLLALSRIALYLGRRIPEVLELSADMIRTNPPRASYDWLITIARTAGINPPDWKEA